MGGWIDELVEFSSSHLDDRVREALYARGVTDEQIQLYRLGYLDRQLPPLQNAKAFLEWSLNGAKLDGVFVLPLTNALGDIKGLQFRHVDRGRSGYSDFFLDQDEPVLFGLAQAMPYVWETGTICLVEGCFDLLPLQRTFPGVVSTLTARAPDSFLRFLRRLVKKVWLVWDGDRTGRNGCAIFTRRFSDDFEIHTLNYPKVTKISGGLVKDPGELWEAWGEQRFSDYIRSSMG